MARPCRTTIYLLLAVGRAALSHAQASAPSHHDRAGDGIGRVSFPTTCAPSVQPGFESAVALLHSFWYEEAGRAFETVAQGDPTCALAYWGAAMSRLHPLWGPPTVAEDSSGLESARRAVRLSRNGSRERDYASAILTFYADRQHRDFRTRINAWDSAMGVVERRNPKDDEARIFHGLSHIAAGQLDPSDTTYRRQREAAQELTPLLERYPDHPGLAHYLIHAFDSPALAHLALDAANRYAAIAPAVPHALHMPSHIYVRLGMWAEAITSNERSAAAAREAERVAGWTAVWAQRLHAMDYLAYARLQLGQDSMARMIVEEAAKVTSTIPEHDLVGDYALAAIPARYALERDDWDAASRLPLRSTPAWRGAEAITHFARAIGAGRLGNERQAQAEVEALEAIELLLRHIGGVQSYWADQARIQRLAAGAWLALLQRDTSGALRQADSAAAMEDATEKHPVTPGPVLPARELYADLLLALGQPAEAETNYRAVLARQPGRARALRGLERAHRASGKT
jgi:hypothetical protein